MPRSTRDASSFDALYRDLHGPLCAQVYALTGDWGEAQEAAQEAFLKAWQRWDTVCGYDDPAAWVTTVAFRAAISRFRKLRNAVVAMRRAGPPPDLPGLGPDTVALVEALRTLPEAQRRALVLHHMADRSVAQVAALEQVAEGTVKARLSRGRVALAAALSLDDPVEGSRV